MDLFPKMLCEHQASSFRDGVCWMPGEALLSCGDICKGNCHLCQQGRVHKTCKEACNKLLICGHKCEFPCKMLCPPCTQKCNTKCSHRECTSVCGSPCVPCKESCTWACPHLKCSKACYDVCDRDMCEHACSVFLNCGHKCVGVCGEICPPCRICHPDKYTDIFHTEEESSLCARYIMLLPCQHPIEESSLKKWLTSNSEEEIIEKKCPKCSSIIENCQHLPEVKANKNTINEIKAKNFGSLEEVAKLRNVILRGMHAAPFNIFSEAQGSSGAEISVLRTLSIVLKNSLKNDTLHNLSKEQLSLLSFKFDFLKAFKIIFDKYWKSYNEKVKDDIFKRAKTLFELMCSFDFFQKQQFEDFKQEINRLIHIGQFEYVCSEGEYLSNRNKANIQQLYDMINKLLYNTFAYTEEHSKEFDKYMENLKSQIKIACQLTREERRMIHAAMCPSFNQGYPSLPQLHWSKCMNGHIYCVSGCGNAMEFSKCPDCKVTIGKGDIKINSSDMLL